METNGEEQIIAQRGNTKDQTNNATEAESRSTGPKNDSQLFGRPEPEMKRLLLFNKVVEKSLQKFIFDARYVHAIHTFIDYGGVDINARRSFIQLQKQT